MEAAARALGQALRGLGAGLDTVGVLLQGKYAHIDRLQPNVTRLAFQGVRPTLGQDVFVAPNATVQGQVTLGTGSSVWYGASLRGDVNPITIGERCNIQDKVTIHVAKHNPRGRSAPTVIGNNVSVGHGAILHACTIHDDSLVGMGAVILDGAVIERGAIVGAGALVTSSTTVPSGQVWAGSPARFLREIAEDEGRFVTQSASAYVALAAEHAAENGKSLREVVQDAVNREDRRDRDVDYDDHLGIARDPVSREIIATAHTYGKVSY